MALGRWKNLAATAPHPLTMEKATESGPRQSASAATSTHTRVGLEAGFKQGSKWGSTWIDRLGEGLSGQMLLCTHTPSIIAGSSIIIAVVFGVSLHVPVAVSL